VEVVAAVHERLANADAFGEDAAVVFEHVVCLRTVCDAALQLDTPSPIAVPGHESEAVDASPTETGAVLTGGQGGYVVRCRALGNHSEIGAPKHGARRSAREVG